MNRKLILTAVVLVLLLLGFVLLFLSSKPSPQIHPEAVSSTEPQSSRDSTRVSGESCCEMVVNSELKDQGRVVVTFPDGLNLSRTMVYVYQPGATHQVALSVGSGTFPLAPGTYDVEVLKIRLTGVSVKAGHDTRVKVGALRINADNATTYRVLDQIQQRELAKGYGKSVFGLPVGHYMLHFRQRNEPVTIEDGTITEY
jgi:hypothetical protein